MIEVATAVVIVLAAAKEAEFEGDRAADVGPITRRTIGSTTGIRCMASRVG